jgi:protein TonB
MERRLFDDLVVSRSGGGGGHARAGAMPFSIAIHAAGLTALLALSMVVREELPEPPPRPGIIIDSVVPPAAAPPGPTVARRAAPTKPRTTAPTYDTPTTPPEAEEFSPDESLVGDPGSDTVGCISCSPDGVGSPDGVPGGDPLGTGSTIVEPPKPVRVGGDIRPPRKINSVDPVYPPLARSAGVGGIVILECVIGRDGRVRTVTVLRGIALLNDAAIDAVRQWTYTPTLLNGVPVEVVMTVTVNFKPR